jgi:hypothetical protein
MKGGMTGPLDFVFRLDSLLWQKYGNNLFPNAKGVWNEPEIVSKMLCFYVYKNREKVQT